MVTVYGIIAACERARLVYRYHDDGLAGRDALIFI